MACEERTFFSVFRLQFLVALLLLCSFIFLVLFLDHFGSTSLSPKNFFLIFVQLLFLLAKTFVNFQSQFIKFKELNFNLFKHLQHTLSFCLFFLSWLRNNFFLASCFLILIFFSIFICCDHVLSIVQIFDFLLNFLKLI